MATGYLHGDRKSLKLTRTNEPPGYFDVGLDAPLVCNVFDRDPAHYRDLAHFRDACI